MGQGGFIAVGVAVAAVVAAVVAGKVVELELDSVLSWS